MSSNYEDISYTDSENGVTYQLRFKPEDPEAVIIIGPRKGEGVLIPGRALIFLLATYRRHALEEHRRGDLQDLMDGQPSGYDT